MKRFIYILAASLSMMFSCQELTIDSQPDAPVSIYIDALDSYSPAGTAPGRIVFNISSNTPWTIKSDSQWCLPSPAMSASSSLVSEIVVTAEDNPDAAPRTATLVIDADGLGEVKTIIVEQGEKIETEPEEPAVPDIKPAAFDVVFAEGVSYTKDPVTGYVKVDLSVGEMFRTAYPITKGRTVIELADMKMSAICNLGFSFIAASQANYKLHLEGNNTYWFRCAGGFGWVAPIKKTYTMEEANAIRKLEFVVEEDPDAAGKLKISIYINDALYGSQTGRTDVFAAGDPGCFFIFEAGLAPAEGDYCTFKSINYINE